MSSAASSSGPAPAAPLLDTLDEPVTETIMRDVRQVGTKLRYVLVPTLPTAEAIAELRNWDLWGPLLLCLALSVLLSSGYARAGGGEGQASQVFAWIFVLVWAGAALVSLNARLLGGNVSFLQSVGVLGYAMAPLVIAGALCAISRATIWRSIIVALAVGWACRGESRRFCGRAWVCGNVRGGPRCCEWFTNLSPPRCLSP
jgi:hypothetical protein